MLDAIPIRQFTAILGTGLRSGFPRFKRFADNLCGPAEAALFIILAGLAPHHDLEFFHDRPPLKARFSDTSPPFFL